MTTVAVCVPTIPNRRDQLDRALLSVDRQSITSDVTLTANVVVDDDGDGAAVTRNRAWRLTDENIDWIAFLDDDDEFRPNHIQACLNHARDNDADLVYPWFNIHNHGGGDISQNDPLRVPVGNHYVSPYGVTFNDALKHELMTRNNFIPITVLVKRSYLDKVGGFPIPGTDEWSEDCCEDWGLWRRLLSADATFSHLPRRTWVWNWHGKNTSGKPWKRKR